MKTNCWSYDGTNETACESNSIQFKIENENHTIKLKSTSGNKIVLQFASTPFDVSFNDGETKNIDLDRDNVFDIQVGVKKKSFSEIDLTIKLLPKPSCSDGVKNQDEEEIDCGGVCNSCDVESEEVTSIDQDSVEEDKKEVVKESNNYVLIGLIVVLLIFAIVFFKNH